MVFWETRRESSSVAWFLLNGSQCEGKWLAIMIFYFTIWKELGLIDIFRDEQSGLYFTLKWPAFSRGKKIRKEDFLDKHCNSFILSCQHGWQDKIKLSFIVSLLLIRKEKKNYLSQTKDVFLFICLFNSFNWLHHCSIAFYFYSIVVCFYLWISLVSLGFCTVPY